MRHQSFPKTYITASRTLPFNLNFRTLPLNLNLRTLRKLRNVFRILRRLIAIYTAAPANRSTTCIASDPANMKTPALALPATLLAFLSLIQPCPAPPVMVGVIAGSAVGASVIVVGSVAAAADQGFGHDHHRRGLAADGDDAASGFDRCVAQGINSTQRVDLLANSSIVVSGLPRPCMDAIDRYNAHPLIEDLNTVHGSTNVISADSVRLDDMPHYVIAAITAARAQMEAKPVPSPRQ